MSVVGIICEYNPFHEGHRYHIQKAKELTGADTVAVVMNGDFVQRGEPAVVDKYARARMALEGGADLVFELPLRYGLSSAEDFAYGGILALESLSFVDYYCFGVENEDKTSHIVRTGTYLAEEPAEYKEVLAGFLREGDSFPAAREKALRMLLGIAADPSGMDDLFEPNHILGMEYVKAAVQLSSQMKPVVVGRKGMGHLGEQLPEPGGEQETFLSAGAIRKGMRQGRILGVSAQTRQLLEKSPCFLEAEAFWGMCSYAIWDRWEELEEYKDVSKEIGDAFRNHWYSACSLTDFLHRCKTKNMTMSRLKRCVFQILLGIRKEESREKKLPYIRLLGMRKQASFLLRGVQDTVVISRLAADRKKLDDAGSPQYRKDAGRKLDMDIRAAELYRNVQMAVSGEWVPEEYRRRLLQWEGRTENEKE